MGSEKFILAKRCKQINNSPEPSKTNSRYSICKRHTSKAHSYKLAHPLTKEHPIKERIDAQT